MKQIPTIQTARLTLRPFTHEDAIPFHRILTEDGILRYFPNPNPPSMEKVESMIEGQLIHWSEHGLGWWVVTLKDHDEMIGWNGLQFLPETGETEVGYLLSKQFWGQGYATEGAIAGIRFGFETLGLNEIIGLVHPENIASQRVLEKSGLKFVNEARYFGMNMFKYTVLNPLFNTG